MFVCMLSHGPLDGLLPNLQAYNMNLIGATFIRASKLSSHASYVGWQDLTEFDFRPRLTDESTAWIAI